MESKILAKPKSATVPPGHIEVDQIYHQIRTEASKNYAAVKDTMHEGQMDWENFP